MLAGSCSRKFKNSTTLKKFKKMPEYASTASIVAQRLKSFCIFLQAIILFAPRNHKYKKKEGTL